MGHSPSSRHQPVDLRLLSVEDLERDPTSFELDPAMLQFIRDCEQAQIDHKRGVFQPVDADKALELDRWDQWLGEKEKDPSL